MQTKTNINVWMHVQYQGTHNKINENKITETEAVNVGHHYDDFQD